MTQLHVDMTNYELTEEQKNVMRRMLQNEADADLLLRMLGVIKEDAEVKAVRRQVTLKCAKHKENKYRTRGGNLVCKTCNQEQKKRRKQT